MAETTMTDMTHPSSNGWRPDLRAPIVMGLAGLLILQLLLALGLGLSGGKTMAPTTGDTPLLGVAPDQVRAIRIEGGDGADSLVLARSDDGWVADDLAGLPIQDLKVDQLLDALAALKRPLPIATSEEARTRFKVADSAFERRLVIEDEKGPIASLLVGDSPGFRRIFAGLPGDPGVYDLRLALSDLSPRRDDWIDMGLLRLEHDDIVRLTTDAWNLTKGEDGSWTLADRNEPLDGEAVDALLLRIANLSYRGVLGIEEDPTYNQQEPRLVLEIGLADGSARHYRISQLKDSQDYVLKADDRPWYFKLSELDLGELLDTEAGDLLATPVTDEAAAAGETPEPSEQSAPAEASTPQEIPQTPGDGETEG